MKIALIAPPFIPVPPKAYGGTELFVAHLAEGLADRGHDVIVYANGESTVDCEVRWLYDNSVWPLPDPTSGTLMHVNHSAWALRDATCSHVDVVQLNDGISVAMSRFIDAPAVHTLHHPYDQTLSELYDRHPELSYVAISDHQRQLECMPRLRTIHHGLRLEDYTYRDRKDGFLSFLGRIAPMKGEHEANEIAKRTGIPLKIGGEIQPAFRRYWETEIAPHVDGRHIEYIGEATPSIKNELLSRSNALLFPISWNEPFGLVMIEAMACGTPVLAFPGGAVEEIVKPGVSGWICNSVEQLAERARDPQIPPAVCRAYVAGRFGVARMVEKYVRAFEDAIAAKDRRPALRGSSVMEAPVPVAEA